MSRVGRFKEARAAYHQARVQGKEARERARADRKAHPEKHTWAAARELERRRFRPTVDELMETAEKADVIVVGQSSEPVYWEMSFNPSGLKTYVSVNGYVFHEIPRLPAVITRDFAREIASMGHSSHDGTWVSPVTGMQYGGCRTWSALSMESPHITLWDHYRVGEPLATARIVPGESRS